MTGEVWKPLTLIVGGLYIAAAGILSTPIVNDYWLTFCIAWAGMVCASIGLVVGISAEMRLWKAPA